MKNIYPKFLLSFFAALLMVSFGHAQKLQNAWSVDSKSKIKTSNFKVNSSVGTCICNSNDKIGRNSVQQHTSIYLTEMKLYQEKMQTKQKLRSQEVKRETLMTLAHIHQNLITPSMNMLHFIFLIFKFECWQ